jgi:preprotein translocase subunit SecF
MIQPTVRNLNIIGRRKLWYGISLAVLIPCAAALIIFGLRLGIDFTGGSVMEVQGNFDQATVDSVTRSNQLENVAISAGADSATFIRYRLPDNVNEQEVQAQIDNQLSEAGLEIVSFNQVGPSVSGDITKNALISIALMSAAIIIYITFVFRKVPKGVSALSFGMSAISALVHDALFVLGIFAIMGVLANVEVDTYIVTAVLTVIGFSVHDTIVVFDRIRENLAKSSESFQKVVETSLQETLVRSLNTSLVIIMVLFALFLFGGQSTRYFVLALLLGMAAGTYSSIFVASPLLVTWHNFSERRKVRAESSAKKSK